MGWLLSSRSRLAVRQSCLDHTTLPYMVCMSRSRDSVLCYHSSSPQPELIAKRLPSSVYVARCIMVVQASSPGITYENPHSSRFNGSHCSPTRLLRVSRTSSVSCDSSDMHVDQQRGRRYVSPIFKTWLKPEIECNHSPNVPRSCEPRRFRIPTHLVASLRC